MLDLWEGHPIQPPHTSGRLHALPSDLLEALSKSYTHKQGGLTSLTSWWFDQSDLVEARAAVVPESPEPLVPPLFRDGGIRVKSGYSGWEGSQGAESGYSGWEGYHESRRC